jgi:Heterokaryon incompatibility protein (HET)
MPVPEEPKLYSRLPENAVRILSLDENPAPTSQSFWRQAKLYCRFEIVVLEFPLIPEYDALSYVWGDASEQIPILCNGLSLTIGRNLFSALSQIWAIEPEKRMWADAICINQADLVEKSAQVAMMARIYASALQVRVWLGPEERLTRLLWERIKLCSNTDQLKAEVDKDIPLQIAFYHLGSRSWFYRIWTYQEIVLALKAIVQCGSLRLDWVTFSHVSNRLPQPNDVLQSSPVRPVGRSKRIENPGFAAVFNLQRELRLTSDRDATDLRDKIYALLGLPTLKLFRQIKPDYSLSTVDAYTQVTRDLIDVAQNLSIFLMSGIANRKEALREALSHPGHSFGNVDPEHPIWKTPSSGLGNRLITPTTPAHDKQWLIAWESIASNLPSWVPNWNAPLNSIVMPETWLKSLEGPTRPFATTGNILGPGSHGDKIELRGRALGLLRVYSFPGSNLMNSHHIESFSDCIRDSAPAEPRGPLVDLNRLCQALKDHEERRCGCSHLEPQTLALKLSGEFYPQTKMASESGDWICILDGFSELCLLRLGSQLSLTRKGFEYVKTPEFELVSPLIMSNPESVRELERRPPGFEVNFIIR